MATFTQYYSQSTGQLRNVCIPTPASVLAAVVPYEARPVVPYTGMAGSATTTTLSTPPPPQVQLAAAPSVLGGYNFVPASAAPAAAPAVYCSWYHPPTYQQALTEAYARPTQPYAHPVSVASPQAHLPSVCLTPSSLGPVFTPTQPPPLMTSGAMAAAAASSSYWHPPTYGGFLAEYGGRPTQPLLRPIQVANSPLERTQVVGRVERHMVPYP